MPDAAEIGAFVLELHDRRDLRKTVDAFHKRILDWCAEVCCHLEKLRGTQLLAAEEDDTVLEPCTTQRMHDRLIKLTSEIDAGHLGTERPRNLPDVHFAL